MERDLETLARAMVGRRRALVAFAGVTLLPLIGCDVDATTAAGGSGGGTGGSGGSGNSTSTSATSSTASGGTCEEVPEETGGPYPADGTNGPNALTSTGIVRSDITSSFGSMTGAAAGVPLTVKFKVVGTTSGCKALSGLAVYIWHCDANGNYSLYTAPDVNYLRGVQETDSTGTVTFQTIFPGCYSGRWPHIHFEIFSSLASATSGTGKLKTSQLAMPEDSCSEVYASGGYASSASNLQQTSLSSDMVFADGASLELPTVTGNPTDGYVLTITVGVVA